LGGLQSVLAILPFKLARLLEGVLGAGIGEQAAARRKTH